MRLVSLLLVALVLAACSSAPQSPTDSPEPPTASPLAALPTPSAAAVPTAKPTPAATEAPALAITETRLTRKVRRGGTARVGVQTEPGAECRIEVTYASGPSDAKGLKAKTANQKGRVNWSWTVGRKTAKGTYPITISCSNGESRGSLSLEFRVR